MDSVRMRRKPGVDRQPSKLGAGIQLQTAHGSHEPRTLAADRGALSRGGFPLRIVSRIPASLSHRQCAAFTQLGGEGPFQGTHLGAIMIAERVQI